MPTNYHINKLIEGIDAINLTSINYINTVTQELTYFASEIVEEQMSIGITETLEEAISKTELITDIITSLNKIKQRLLNQ